MTIGELKKQLSEWDDDDAIIVSGCGNTWHSFKIIGVEDTTCVGVEKIKIAFFETDNFWEE